jgi:hypothetical protein
MSAALRRNDRFAMLVDDNRHDLATGFDGMHGDASRFKGPRDKIRSGFRARRPSNTTKG